MLSKKHLLFVLFALFIGFAPLWAQDDEEIDDQPEATESTDEDTPDDEEVSDDTDDYPYPGFREAEYSDFVNNRRQDQQEKFLNGEYTHPARPKDKWELGLNAGILLISGDVQTGIGKYGWSASGNFCPKLGYGLHVRRSLGYIFSLRLSGMAGSTWGRSWKPVQGWAQSSITEDPGFVPNKALAGGGGIDRVTGSYDPAKDRYADFNPDYTTPNYNYRTSDRDYIKENANQIYYNYKTDIKELILSGIVSLHNLRFHKRQTKLDLYGLFGTGVLAYRARMDQLDENGIEYDYSVVYNASNQSEYEGRNPALEALDDLRDGTFESQAERHFDDPPKAIGVLFNNHSFKPTAHVGLGLAFKLSRVINLALETRVTYTNDDLLDGQRWQEWGALTRDYDTYVYNGLHANFNIGGKNSVEPLWWMNPIDYSDENCCDEIPEVPDLADDDGDGVPNAWDEEPDSRENCPVDTRGRMLDSDGDGILDCDDDCPFSAPYDPFTGAYILDKVDEKGCYKTKLDCESWKGLVGGCEGCCPVPKQVVHTPLPPPDPCSMVGVMPSILFDLNKYSVRPEFRGQLQSIANTMKANPSAHFCVVGHTDARSGNAYNNVLSWKRANEVVNILVRDYGVSRGQVSVQYRGEDSPVVGGLSDSSVQKNLDADHALNRRVEITCGHCSDMPMPSGPSNAGTRKPRP